MELSKKSKIFFGVLILLFIWMAIISYSWLHFTPKSTSGDYVPNEANIVLKINSSTIIKSTASDLIFKNKLNPDQIGNFDNYFSEESQSDGINYEATSFLFTENWNNHEVIGFIVNLNNEDDFDKAFKSEENSVIVHNKSTGIILTVLSADDIDMSLYENYGKDLINGEIKNATERLPFVSTVTDESMMEYYIKGNSRSFMQDIVGDVRMQNNKVILNASANRNSIFSKDKILDFKSYNKSTNQAFEVTSGKLPDTVMTFFQNTLNQADIYLPEIQSQSIQYFGSKVENIEGKMMVQPQFDGIFRFYKDVNIKEKSEKFSNLNERVMDSDSSHIKIGTTTYYLHQINQDHIYIGVHENYQFDYNSDSTVFSVKGNLKNLFALDGKSYVVSIAKLLPAFKNSKWLADQIDNFDVNAKPSNNFNTLNIQGEITFLEEKSPALVLAEYFVRMIR